MEWQGGGVLGMIPERLEKRKMVSHTGLVSRHSSNVMVQLLVTGQVTSHLSKKMAR